MQQVRAHHVGVTVSDLDSVVDVYERLGLDCVARFSVAGEAFSTAVGVEGASADFAHLDAEGVRIELVAYEPEAAAAESSEVNRPGTAHIGLSVDDVDAFYDALPDAVETRSAPQRTESGTKILFLEDPEGNLVEILDA